MLNFIWPIYCLATRPTTHPKVPGWNKYNEQACEVCKRSEWIDDVIDNSCGDNSKPFFMVMNVWPWDEGQCKIARLTFIKWVTYILKMSYSYISTSYDE
jgi:hypothetical protein